MIRDPISTLRSSTPTQPLPPSRPKARHFRPAQRLQYVESRRPRRESVVIAPGVRWARIPLPLDLNHINVWLIETDDGCVVVDTGMAQSARMRGKRSSANVLEAAAARRVRHAHSSGSHRPCRLAAGTLRVPVLMSPRTHDMVREFCATGEGRPRAGGRGVLRSHGLAMSRRSADVQSRAIGAHDQRYAASRTFHRGRRSVALGRGEWTALETNGHAEGHLCLSNAASRALISGDQVLPTISSNISFRFASPIRIRWDRILDSLQRLRALPEDTLVLPSHGVPFYGLRQRIDDLRGHHLEQFEKSRRCGEPKAAAELLPHMFRRELTGMHLFLAMGEALAHLEYLVHAGRLQRNTSAGIVRYAAQ